MLFLRRRVKFQKEEENKKKNEKEEGGRRRKKKRNKKKNKTKKRRKKKIQAFSCFSCLLPTKVPPLSGLAVLRTGIIENRFQERRTPAPVLRP